MTPHHHRDEQPLISSAKFWLTLFAIVFIVALFTGCMTPKKAVDYLKKKELLADTCASNFPVKDSITKVTVDSVVFDTLYLDGQIVVDSIYLERGDNKNYEITKVITKTITKTVEVKVRDRAYETALNEANVAIQKQLGAAETKSAALEELNAGQKITIKGKNKKIFWLYVIIAVLIAWNFRKLIARLINPIKAIIPICLMLFLSSDISAQTSHTFTGIGTDEDGYIVAYKWEQLNLFPRQVYIASPNNPVTTVSWFDVVGKYQLLFTVTDNQGGIDKDTVDVYVSPGLINASPIAYAGKDSTTNQTTIKLVGSGKDMDGFITAYLWEKKSGGVAKISSTLTASTNVTGMKVGDYVFRLTVTDDKGAKGSDDVLIRIVKRK